MAKHIDSRNLPMFRYFKPIGKEERNNIVSECQLLIEYYQFFMEAQSGKREPGSGAGITFADEDQISLTHAADVIIKKCAYEYPERYICLDQVSCNIPRLIRKELELAQEREKMLPVHNKDQRLHTEGMIVLSIDFLTMIQTIPIIRGELFEGFTDREGNEHSAYPKLFLVNGEIFKKETANISFDYSKLFSCYPFGIAYEGCVQDQVIRERKYAFHINRVNADTINIYLVDPTVGISCFSLEQVEEHSFRFCCNSNCLMKSGGTCPHFKDMGQCVDHPDNCPTGKMPAAMAMLRCLEELLYSQSLTKNKKKKATGDGESIESFHSPEEIQVIDYYKDKAPEFPERSSLPRQGNGTAKRPHARRGGIRILKSGKMVPFRATMVHKDQFKEFSSAERINQKKGAK